MDESSNHSLKYCPYCMELDNIEESDTCPHCGRKSGNAENAEEDLPIYTVLDSRYMVGISEEHTEDTNTYIGLDLTDKKKVWIKEFFYRSLVYRTEDSSSIQTYAGQKESYLKKYDACVREYQKSNDGNKQVVFSNGTVYQIIPLSKEENRTLCQNSPAPEVSSNVEEKTQQEGKSSAAIQQEKDAGENIFTKLLTSKKAKIAVLVLLAVCTVGSLLQKYKIGNISGGRKEQTETAYTSTASTAPVDTSGPGTSVPASGINVSSSPSPSPGQNAGNQSMASETPKTTLQPRVTKNPAIAKHSKQKPGRKPAAARKSMVTRKPAAAGKPAVTRKPRMSRKPRPKPAERPAVAKKNQQNKTQKPKSKKNEIDDSIVNKKVYEID